MVANVPYSPFATTNSPGSFNVESTGLVIGMAYDDPTSRNWLAGGVLATSETLPMWGGVAISESVPGLAGGPVIALGPFVTRATSLTSATNPLDGFSVYNQAHHMIASPSSQAPVSVGGQSVHFYRMGTRARIAVTCSASLASLRGQSILNQVSWDFVNQQVVPAQAAYAANTLTAASWANTNGGQVSYTTTTAHGIAVGQSVTISGMTPAGYNGSFVTVAGTTGSTIVVAMPTNPGTATAFGTLAAGGGILPVRLLDINVGNSIGPVYNAATGACIYNYQANAAVIEI